MAKEGASVSIRIPTTRWLIAENGVAVGGERACDNCARHTLFKITIDDENEPTHYFLCSHCDTEER